MSIHLVALTEPSEKAWSNLKNEERLRNHFVLTDHLALVATEPLVLTEEVCESVGMDDEGEVAGFVTEVDYGTINGWTRKGFREFFRKNQ